MWPHELKLQRAAQHLEKLKAEVFRWEEGEGYSLLIQPDSKPPHYVAYAEIDEPVDEGRFAFLIGDFLHNARAALDYLACALGDAGAAGGFMLEDVATETMFPIVGGVDIDGTEWGGSDVFQRRAARRLSTVVEPARAVIESLQPYKTGGRLWSSEPLWILNELARFDRHRFLHLGIARAGGFRLDPDRSRNVRLTDLSAETGTYGLLEGLAFEDRAESEAMGVPHRYPDGAMLARFTAEPIDPGKEMEMHFEGALEITFDVDRLPQSVFRVLEGDSIISALWFIPDEIGKVFDALAPFLPDKPPPW